MLRLFGFVLTFVLGVGGFVAVDYASAKRWTGGEAAKGLHFSQYLGSLPARFSGSSASSATGLPRALADMMPAAPEGWTVRPAVAADLEGFLPQKSTNETLAAQKYVKALGAAASGSGAEIVFLTYEKGERRVVIEATRFPDLIFTSQMAMAQRVELQTVQAQFRGRPYMTVRGLDVTEDVLPDGMRGRYFLANVAGQIHLRMLTGKRMKDEDLIPFFKTLHVKAMNASVIDKEHGLGDVPVIVLASALDPATREIYDAERTARREAQAARREADRLAAEAAALATNVVDASAATSETVSQGRLTLSGAAGGKPGRNDCQERAGTKFCGVGTPGN